MSWTDEIKFDERGLVPVVAQDARTGEVLMLAWANAQALRLTAETGWAHYWSRSRGELWKKGDTSGNAQEVVEVRVDCDADAVLYRVTVLENGPACHTGERSCFYRRVDEGELREGGDARHVLSRVEEIVAARDAERPEGSYTTYLFEKGVDKVLKKVGEESTEVIIAAKNEGTADLAAESADLIYHLMVLWRSRGLPPDDVWAVLHSRFGRTAHAPPAERRSSEIG